MKSILIGNGLNNRIGINDLSNKQISERFKTNLERYSPIFNALFSVKIDDDEVDKIFKKNTGDNIELLGEKIHKHLCEKKQILHLCTNVNDAGFPTLGLAIPNDVFGITFSSDRA